MEIKIYFEWHNTGNATHLNLRDEAKAVWKVLNTYLGGKG